MKIVFAFFAARRYWKDDTELENAYNELKVMAKDSSCFLITDKNNVKPESADCIVVCAMSGAMQKTIISTCENYKSTIIYGAYIKGNASDKICSLMLKNNSAPAVMDTWGVMHRSNKNVMLALNEADLNSDIKVLNAYFHVKNARVLKIGNTEPWVISNAANEEFYKNKFGFEIVHCTQEEVAEIYRNTTFEEGEKYYDHFVKNADGCKEPNENDLRNASKMAAAIVKVLDKYNADCAAIACFKLLETGTNACLGVSYVNDCTDKVIACECDMDSAVTMLMMKKLTKYKLWMANPGLQPDKRINFSHCTAPFAVCNDNLPFILRNHHESGIGVSLQVEMPKDITVTACRVSDDCNKITVQKGISRKGEYENACRTQLYIEFEDYDKYLETALGCHQVFAFEDIADEMKKLAGLFDIEVL